MPPTFPLPDELEFNEPNLIPTLGFGPELNGQNILWYFMNSPFFDHASNNQALFLKVQSSQNMEFRNTLLFNRLAFEDHLRTQYREGVHFVVTQEPKEPGQPWVIQRQSRVVDESTGEVRTEVQGTWFTSGTKVLMAPSLADVVRTRLLAVSTLMQGAFEQGQSLAHWSPSTGHTYMPPIYTSSADSKPTLPGSASRAGSVAPGGVDLEASQSQNTTQPQLETQITEFSDDFFLQSLALTNRYGNEYNDENPLQGEPGSFVFASTREHLEAARNKAQAAAQAAAPVKQAEGESAVNSVAPTPTPKPLAGLADAGSRKGSVAGLPSGIKGKDGVKEKRRKSKGLTSPISPTGPTAP